MTAASPLFLTALEQARLIREGTLSPVELTAAFLQQIDELNPALGAYVTVDHEGAMAAARAAERRAGDALPPFHGVPISIKDLTETAGLRTTHGLLGMSENVPLVDATVVRRLRAAGFVVLGKTTTPALGLGCVSEPLGFPAARNPWDPTRTPGGSSGGAAAALAAGMCSVAHGSDGGGSIRIPAAWCGLVGLKPSRGRVSPWPSASSFTATHGPITRDVADAAALLDVMGGNEPGDAYWAPVPDRPFAEAALEAPPRLRIAVATDDREVTPEIRQALDTAASLLDDEGHTVTAREPVAGWSHVLDRGVAGLAAGAWSGGLPEDAELDPVPAQLGALTAGVLAHEAAGMEATVHALAERAARAFTDIDVLLTPTVAKLPPRIGEHRNLSVEDLFVMWESYVPFTTIWNYSGQPAISLPAGQTGDGLPVAVQLVARPWADATLLQVARQLADALGSPLGRPPAGLPLRAG